MIDTKILTNYCDHNLKDQCLWTEKIIESVRAEAQPSITSEGQLARCIAFIKGKEKQKSLDLERKEPMLEIQGRFELQKYQKV